MIAETTFKDLPALQLSDNFVRLTIIPQWGGKVSEIVDLRRGRQWLSENAALPYRLPEYGANYVRDFDVGGLDECFPTVGACYAPAAPWKGTPLPDHGEVWALPWAVRLGGEILRLSTYGVRLPYRLEKSIRLLGGGKVRFDYKASNLSPFPMPFLWSSHPLFALRPGMEIRLPTPRLRVFAAPTPGFPAHHGDLVDWPHPDLTPVPGPDAGLIAKLFSPPLTEGWAELVDSADGAAFRFEFDPGQVTHLGLWLNYGGWAGVPGAAPYFNLGLEPCIGAPDTLDTAVDHWGEYGLLPPTGSLAWWLQMAVS